MCYSRLEQLYPSILGRSETPPPSTSQFEAPLPSASPFEPPHPSTSLSEAPIPSTSSFEAPLPSTSQFEAAPSTSQFEAAPSTSLPAALPRASPRTTLNARFDDGCGQPAEQYEISLLKHQFNQRRIAQPDGVRWIRKVIRGMRLSWCPKMKSWKVRGRWSDGRRREETFPVVLGEEDRCFYQALSCRERNIPLNSGVYWQEKRQCWTCRIICHGHRMEKSFMCKNYVDKQDAYRAAVEYRSQAVEKKIQEIVAMVRSILGPPDDHATPANNSDGAPLPSVSEGVSTESLPAVSEIFNRIKFYRFLNKWECDGLENGVQVRKWFSATGRSRTGALREALHWYLRHSTPRHPETYQSQLTIPKDIRWKTGAWEVHHSDVHAQRSLVLFKVDDNTPAEVALASAVRHRDRLINKKVEALIQVYEQETRDRLTRQT